jgi:3',5'-cyclic-AMP phosphodiesterase
MDEQRALLAAGGSDTEVGMIIAQISDPHITLEHGAANPEHDTAIDLQHAVAHLMRLRAPPDLVLVTGDCVNGGSLAEYERFRALLRPLPMPVYVIPGNHDDRGQLLALFGPQGATPLPGFVQYVVDDWPVRLIALDTLVPQRDEGYLCAQRLAWLEARLAEAPTRPTVICMHHPPFLTGLTVLDQIGLTNADALGAIVARHPQIERIVAGHVHMTMLRRFGGTLAISCAATAHQMLPDVQQPERLAVVMEPPTCLLHVWRDSTALVTYTSLIGDHGPVCTIHDGEKWLL